MIQYLELYHFRKFQELKLNFKSKIVIFAGPNATGKTTILEAIYLLSTSKSHRTSDIQSLIQNEESSCFAELKADKTYKIEITSDGKKSYINDIFYSKLSDFIGKNPVLLFSPYDLELIQGSKSARRRSFEIEL